MCKFKRTFINYMALSTTMLFSVWLNIVVCQSRYNITYWNCLIVSNILSAYVWMQAMTILVIKKIFIMYYVLCLEYILFNYACIYYIHMIRMWFLTEYSTQYRFKIRNIIIIWDIDNHKEKCPNPHHNPNHR